MCRHNSKFAEITTSRCDFDKLNVLPSKHYIEDVNILSIHSIRYFFFFKDQSDIFDRTFLF